MGKAKGFMPAIILALIVLITTGLLALTSEMTAAARAYQVDAAAGRVDVTAVRTSDTTGATGDGVLAVVVFDAVGAGVSALGLGGVVTNPGGLPIPEQFGQASITVR